MEWIERVRVSTVQNVDRVRDRLSFEFKFLTDQGLEVSLEESRSGETTVFACGLAASRPGSGQPPTARDDLEKMFHHHVANALSDLIVNEWEKTLLGQLIDTHYHNFSSGEQKVILTAAGRNLDYRDDGRPDLLRKVERKGLVLRRIIEYLNADKDLNIDGFVTFRLRDYCEELVEALGQAVDDFLLEKEYLEFISLLRYFVDNQESKLPLVHVVILPRGEFRLIDEHGAVVKNEYLAQAFSGSDTDLNSEDLLISALITIAPGRLVLHCPPQLDRMEHLDTIRSVFEDRLTTCRGCSLCREQRRAHGTTTRRQTRKTPH